MDTISVGLADTELEVLQRGNGDAILLVQTGLTADELLPLAKNPALDGYRTLVSHRRGYCGSAPVQGPGSIGRDARDCAAILRALGIPSAHVVGLSYSGAVALQLAADEPRLVRTLTVIEPPPVHTRSGPAFRAANEQLLRTRREHGTQAALDEFLTMIVGAGWDDGMDAVLPGSSAQMRRDAATFIDTDLPALLAWRFGPADAARIRCPVLYVGGTDSGHWWDEVHDLLLTWLPHAAQAMVPGADHSLALTHTAEVAGAVAAFLAARQG